MLETGWWVLFTLAGIWAQYFVPGVDFFAPGLVIALQRRQWTVVAWLIAFWVLLLDGSGNLAFGYGLGWYGGLLLFFSVGQWLFEVRSLSFLCLLGLGLGGLHVILIYALTSLQDLAFPLERVVLEGVLQAVVFPVEWAVVNRFYPERLHGDERSL